MNRDIRIGRSARFNGTVTFFLCFAVVSAAHADLATYRFTSRLESPSGDGFLEGFVTFDASLREPGDVGAANFLDWGFTWGGDFTYGPTTHSFDPAFDPGSSDFELADDLSVLSWSLCFSVDGICRLISHPVVLIQGSAGGSMTTASTSPSRQIGNSSGAWDGGTVLPEFTADLTVTRAILKYRSPSQDEVDLRGQLILTEDSDGIVDPISETVVIEVGEFRLGIPPGSFTSDAPGQYFFSTPADDVSVAIQEQHDGAFSLRVRAKGIDLSGTTNPVLVQLVIGNDRGKTTARLSGVLRR